MKTPRLKCIEMEEAIARMFGIRQHIIVPNVSWGLGLHECDLLVVRQSNYALEIEIKTTVADLKKDFEKRHGHISEKIKEFYYAVPAYIYEKALPLIPITAGIIVVEKRFIQYTKNSAGYDCDAFIKRNAVKNKFARGLTDAEVVTVTRLGCMRIWGLKAKLIKAVEVQP